VRGAVAPAGPRFAALHAKQFFALRSNPLADRAGHFRSGNAPSDGRRRANRRPPPPYTINPYGHDSDAAVTPAGELSLPLLAACCRHAADKILREMSGPEREDPVTAARLTGDYVALHLAADLLDLADGASAERLAPRALRMVRVAETYLDRIRRATEGS
jgi:hypothetical protein